MKLRPKHDQIISSKVEITSHVNAIEDEADDAQPSSQIQLPPWAEAYEISSTDMDGKAYRISMRAT